MRKMMVLSIVVAAAVLCTLTLPSVVAQQKFKSDVEPDLGNVETVQIVIRERRIPEGSPSLEGRLRKILENTVRQRGLSVTGGKNKPSDAVITVDCEERWIGAMYTGGTYAFTGLDMNADIELKTRGGTVRKSKYQAKREPDSSFLKGEHSTSNFQLPADLLDMLIPRVNSLFDSLEGMDEVAVSITGKVQWREVCLLALPPGTDEYPPEVAPLTPGSYGANIPSILVTECKRQDNTPIPSLSDKYVRIVGMACDEVDKLIDKQVNISGTLRKGWKVVDVNSIEE